MNSQLEWARSFAVQAHAGQHYGEQSYFTGHLMPVVERVRIAALPWMPAEEVERLMVIAYLHDALEDTQATREELARELDEEIVCVIEDLTKPKGTRRETLRPHLEAVARTKEGRLVKLADRVTNVAMGDQRLRSMYFRESEVFRELLHRSTDVEAEGLWREMHRLCASGL